MRQRRRHSSIRQLRGWCKGAAATARTVAVRLRHPRAAVCEPPEGFAAGRGLLDSGAGPRTWGPDVAPTPDAHGTREAAGTRQQGVAVGGGSCLRWWVCPRWVPVLMGSPWPVCVARAGACGGGGRTRFTHDSAACPMPAWPGCVRSSSPVQPSMPAPAGQSKGMKPLHTDGRRGGNHRPCVGVAGRITTRRSRRGGGRTYM